MAQSLSRPATVSGTNGREAGSDFEDPRLRREWKTMVVMIRSYCAHHHGPGATLCNECQALQDYARLRLDRCRFGAEKPTCARCPVHCYQPERREQIRTVMRFSGPRMVIEHPWLSLRHWLDSFRRVSVS